MARLAASNVLSENLAACSESKSSSLTISPVFRSRTMYRNCSISASDAALELAAEGADEVELAARGSATEETEEEAERPGAAPAPFEALEDTDEEAERVGGALAW